MATYNVGTCVMLIIFVLFLCDVVTAIGKEGRRNISREDYLTAKRKLQSLNRPSVKSIQTQNGDIFDCVDINRQPAFDHPLLKDHTIQLRPSFEPNHMKENSSYATLDDDIGLENGGCPDGTVPILRTQAADLLRAGSISDFGRKSYGGAHHYAVKQGSGKFYGVMGNLNLWKPNLDSDQQFSLSQMWIVNTTGVLNTIEAGWHVLPTIYHLDHTPRLFVYWTADNYQTTGCYNLLCPGFVQVNKFIPVGLPLDKVSQSMKVQREIQLIILRDPASGNWWLSYGVDMIGYWPNALFTNLKEGGNQVSWGGEVCVTPFDSRKTYPQMGSGAYSSRGYRKASYTSKLQVAEDQHQISFVDFHDSKPLVTIPHCYSLTDAHEPNLAPGFFFGGPGHCP